MVQALIFLLSVAVVLFFYFVLDKKSKSFYTILKTIAIVYFFVAFCRYFFSDAFIKVIGGGVFGDEYILKHDFLQTFLRWGQYVSYVVLPMAIFFKSRLFKNIAIYFCLPLTILNIIFFHQFIEYFMTETGRGFLMSQGFRQFYFALELVLSLSIPLIFLVCERHCINLKDKTEVRNFLLSLPFIILILMPVYVPQSLFGYTEITASAFTIGNIVWITIAIIEIAVFYVMFRFKDYRQRFMVCMFLALALFMHYNSLFLMGFNIQRLPIQLCNLGAYFFVIALLIKSTKFFNFVFLANVMGTIIAMVMPDTNGGVAMFWNVHFLIEHMQVLVVPLLCMMLRIFPRLQKGAYKHLWVGFTCYFMFCLIAGTIINGYQLETGWGRVNFFYIFDAKLAMGVFPFLSFTYDIRFTLFGRFEFIPIFQFIIYAGFLILCLTLLYAANLLCKVLDDHLELREQRIRIYEKVTGKKSKAPREFIE